MNSNYWLKIDYAKGEGNPERVFQSMANLIEAFQAFDRDLAKVISVEFETTAILEDIQTGSLKACIANIIKSIPDDALKDVDWKKAVGPFLLKGKYKLLEFLEDKQTIESHEDLKQLNNEFVSMAREVDILHLPTFTPIPEAKLLADMRSISVAALPLKEQDQVSIIINDTESPLNRRFTLSEEKIISIVSEQSSKTHMEVVLKVKKPDFLGRSKWDMKYGQKSVTVKIEDQEWLKKFHRKQIPVLPGDSLRCYVTLEEDIDESGQLISENYIATKVYEVIKDSTFQPKLY